MSVQVDTAALGKPVPGPRAFSGNPRRFLALTLTLAAMEFKVRFFGSVLGYVWQLLRPLLLFSVLYVVFTEFVKINAGVDYFPAVLLMGVVLFTFFADATSRAVTSVLDHENLVRKIQFPRMVVPIAAVLSATFNLALNSLAVLVFVLATGVDPKLTWLLLPVLLLPLFVLATGIAMLVSALYVRFRDVQPIWEVVLQVLFYASPILYAIEVIPGRVQKLVMTFNPLASVLQQTRHWIIDGGAPTAAEAIGGAERLLVPGAMIAGAFLVGLWVFNREAPRIAEEL